MKWTETAFGNAESVLSFRFFIKKTAKAFASAVFSITLRLFFSEKLRPADYCGGDGNDAQRGGGSDD